MINFKFLSIRVNIHPSFLLFFLFFTGMHREVTVYSLVYGAVLVISLLVHEYGHGLAVLYCGAQPEINLEAFGGNARYNGANMTDNQDFFITICGPLLESVLILVPYLLLQSDLIDNGFVRQVLYITMKLNILWCLFNLIPVYPLDGGHISQYLFQRFFGDKGVKIGQIVGFIAAAIGSVYFLLEGYFFFTGLLLFYGYQNFQMYRHTLAANDRPNPFSLYKRGIECLESNNTETAKTIFKKLIKMQDKDLKLAATESLAKVMHQENNSKESYQLLLNTDHSSLQTTKGLLLRLAYHAENYMLVETLSREVYNLEPSYEIAILNSKAFAHLNNPFYAGGWLRTASHFENVKATDLESVLQDPAYDRVKNNENFTKLIPDFSSETKVL